LPDGVGHSLFYAIGCSFIRERRHSDCTAVTGTKVFIGQPVAATGKRSQKAQQPNPIQNVVPPIEVVSYQTVDEVYAYALKLLRARDYTVEAFCKKVQSKFGHVPQGLTEELLKKNFLNDRRYAENHVRRRADRGRGLLRVELIERGIEANLVDEVLAAAPWPSIREALTARMKDWQLRAPLQPNDAARLDGTRAVVLPCQGGHSSALASRGLPRAEMALDPGTATIGPPIAALRASW